MTKHKKDLIIISLIILFCIFIISILWGTNWFIFDKPRNQAIQQISFELNNIKILDNNKTQSEAKINGDSLTGNKDAAFATASFPVNNTFGNLNNQINNLLKDQGYNLLRDSTGIAYYVTANKSLWQRYEKNDKTLSIEYVFENQLECPSSQQCKYIAKSSCYNVSQKNNVADIAIFNDQKVTNLYIKYQKTEWMGVWY